MNGEGEGVLPMLLDDKVVLRGQYDATFFMAVLKACSSLQCSFSRPHNLAEI